MAMTKLAASVAIISALGDRPNQDNGLTAAAMKAKYDEAATIIKTFINDVLLAEIDSNIATKAELAGIVLGTVSPDSILENLLAPAVRAKLNAFVGVDETTDVAYNLVIDNGVMYLEEA